MAEWKEYKNVRKLVKEKEDFFRVTYYNCTYSRQTVRLVNMLVEEIHKDFPEVSEGDIFISQLPDLPNETLLTFLIEKSETSRSKISGFEKMPDDLTEL